MPALFGPPIPTFESNFFSSLPVPPPMLCPVLGLLCTDLTIRIRQSLSAVSYGVYAEWFPLVRFRFESLFVQFRFELFYAIYEDAFVVGPVAGDGVKTADYLPDVGAGVDLRFDSDDAVHLADCLGHPGAGVVLGWSGGFEVVGEGQS
jgi:hypothetical protein